VTVVINNNHTTRLTLTKNTFNTIDSVSIITIVQNNNCCIFVYIHCNLGMMIFCSERLFTRLGSSGSFLLNEKLVFSSTRYNNKNKYSVDCKPVNTINARYTNTNAL